ncbi:MAG: hypothetical protein PHD65_07010 [Gallionella sp.]|nr:hypothetical protein [Gallionella sp.]
MRKVILMALLVAVSSSAMAEWVTITGNKILAFTAYADANTEATIKNGDKVKMWKMYDYKSSQEVSGYKFLSSEFQNEYDCKEGQSRILANTTYSINMGVGEVIFAQSDTGKWQSVIPDSIDEAMWKFACRKK